MKHVVSSASFGTGRCEVNISLNFVNIVVSYPSPFFLIPKLIATNYLFTYYRC